MARVLLLFHAFRFRRLIKFDPIRHFLASLSSRFIGSLQEASGVSGSFRSFSSYLSNFFIMFFLNRLGRYGSTNVNVLEVETFEDKPNHEDVEGKKGKDCSELANIFRHRFEFLLEGSLLVTLFHLGQDHSEAGIFTDHEAEEGTFTLGDRSS